VSFEFRQESDDALHDPTNVFFTWRLEDGDETTYEFGADAELVNDGVGLYHVDIDGATEGIYYTRAYATETGQSAEERQFEVISNFLT
jgi:hypothetical protein